mgnify:CR=1 FL=1
MKMKKIVIKINFTLCDLGHLWYTAIDKIMGILVSS